MLEIRWHGRGGQGAVTAAEILATSVINEGKCAQAFAAFGPERRGAPVLAFTRISDREILTRCQIYEPDIIVVLDKNLCTMEGVGDGLKDGGIVVLNTDQKAEDYLQIFGNAGKIAVVDATEIALRELGTPITNTAILGALVRTTGIVKLESLEDVMKQRFRQYAERNISAVRRAFEGTVLFETGERK